MTNHVGRKKKKKKKGATEQNHYSALGKRVFLSEVIHVRGLCIYSIVVLLK